ncbi:MAG: hypothetical protein FH749_10355 [Firmicutes bacterium]|nr:hypothetical protein [Bacillota bacterium]
MKKYLSTIKLSATRAFDGGVLYILSNYVLQVAQMIILMLIWRSLAAQGADLGGFTLEQLLVYTLLSSIFREQLNITTPATTAFWEGAIISRYTRPAPVLAQLTSETIGSWIPGLLLYTLPMLIAAPFLNIEFFSSMLANGPLFLVSFTLALALGFAFDYLFASLVIHLKNANYTAYAIRQAIIRLFSGAIIPFALLPWGLGNILELLPFGSIASAPLLIFVGAGDIWRLLGLQIFWNLVLWPVALLAFRRSEERMVSYGG